MLNLQDMIRLSGPPHWGKLIPDHVVSEIDDDNVLAHVVYGKSQTNLRT